MNRNTGRSRERLLQLLADHATEVLDSTSATELAELLLLHPEYDESYFEPAAAAIDLAMVPLSSEPLPYGLRDRILLDAEWFLESGQN